MWEDTLVEEIHAIRAQLLAQFDGDLHQYCEFVRTHPAPATPSASTAPDSLGLVTPTAPLIPPAPHPA